MKFLLAIAIALLVCGAAKAKEPYVIAIFPDQQTNCRPDTLTWPNAMVNWVIAERAAYDVDSETGRNVRAIVMTGDISNDAGEPVLECGEPALARWQTALNLAKTASLPVVTLAGNHDMEVIDCPQPGPPDWEDCADTYRSYFGSAYWSGQSYFKGCADASVGTRYAEDMNCAFVVPTGNGTDEIALITSEWREFNTGQDSLFAARNWVQGQMQTYSHMPAMLFTHEHLSTGTPPVVSCFKGGTDSYWHDGLKGENNWVATYNGHDVNGQAGYVSGVSDPNLYNWACNRDVLLDRNFWSHQNMTNYQRIEAVPVTGAGGGDGLVLFVTIDEDSGSLAHESCSPPSIGDYCRVESMREGYTRSINLKNRRASTGCVGCGF